jgi:WhiB family transcriptional regulator, redox-sensing transcriptional regulator
VPIMQDIMPNANWQDRAACRGQDVELFYSQEGADVRAALAICAACVVQAECYDQAMADREAFGVWGGTAETERRRIFRRERRTRQDPAA